MKKEVVFYVLFLFTLTPTTEGLSQFLPKHPAFTSTTQYRRQAQQHTVVNSQSPLQLPKRKCHRNAETWIGIRLQKSLEPLWLAPTEPETPNEWIPQCFIVIRYVSETGISIAAPALIEHNANQRSEMPNGKFNNLIQEPGIQIPVWFWVFFLIREEKKKRTGLTCHYTKQRPGECPELPCKCCFISLRLLINKL